MRRTVAPPSNSARPVGLAWLHEHFALPVPEPSVRSEVVDSGRATYELEGRIVERYTRQYEPHNVRGHLRFALRYEPLDLRVLKSALAALGPSVIEEWIRDQPTGGYARRAWYLYEVLLHTRIDVPDMSVGNYVPLANDKLQVTGDNCSSQRHRVTDNLLGVPEYSPLIRITPRLSDWMNAPLKQDAIKLVEGVDPVLLARASQYLYTRETKSSYAIERAEPPRNYLERFVSLLASAERFEPTEDSLVQLQNAIVEPRYAESDWRHEQNYVGETRSDYTEVAHFVCPRPQDVPELMSGWERSLEWMRTCHPVIAAASASFGFVLIHPFLDGNGRIHRYLIHAILAKRGFTPNDIVFPVSSVMLRHRRDYERVLDQHAESIMPFIEYTLHGPGDLEVHNQTVDLYRYPDLTSFAEYLFACIEETIQRDLAEELGFLTRFDQVRAAIRDVIDMPDVQLRQLVTYIHQNGGHLSNNKRKQFPELTDQEIERIIEVVEPLFGNE